MLASGLFCFVLCNVLSSTSGIYGRDIQRTKLLIFFLPRAVSPLIGYSKSSFTQESNKAIVWVRPSVTLAALGPGMTKTLVVTSGQPWRVGCVTAGHLVYHFHQIVSNNPCNPDFRFLLLLLLIVIKLNQFGVFCTQAMLPRCHLSCLCEIWFGTIRWLIDLVTTDTSSGLC